MASQVQICGLVYGLRDIRDGLLDGLKVGLFTNDVRPLVSVCDETVFVPPTWSGYAAQTAKPWSRVRAESDQHMARTQSTLLVYSVNSPPGSAVVHGWYAFDPHEPVHKRLRIYAYYSKPETPVMGVPIYVVARVYLGNCPP